MVQTCFNSCLTLLHWAPSRAHRAQRKPAQSNSHKTCLLQLLVSLKREDEQKQKDKYKLSTSYYTWLMNKSYVFHNIR